MSLLSRFLEVTMSVSRRCCSALLLLLACGSFVAAQAPAPGTRAYVCSDSTESVIVVDTATDPAVGTIKTSRQPRGLAFTPDGKTLLITCVAHDVMYYVNTATNQAETIVGIGRSPQSVAVTPDGRLAFSVTREVRPGGAASTVTIMDLRNNCRRKVKDIPVDNLATKVVVSPDGA
jgi:YVTN family beta-propeller protein